MWSQITTTFGNSAASAVSRGMLLWKSQQSKERL
jgi:hypothetical protein